MIYAAAALLAVPSPVWAWRKAATLGLLAAHHAHKSGTQCVPTPPLHVTDSSNKQARPCCYPAARRLLTCCSERCRRSSSSLMRVLTRCSALTCIGVYVWLCTCACTTQHTSLEMQNTLHCCVRGVYVCLLNSQPPSACPCACCLCV